MDPVSVRVYQRLYVSLVSQEVQPGGQSAITSNCWWYATDQSAAQPTNSVRWASDIEIQLINGVSSTALLEILVFPGYANGVVVPLPASMTITNSSSTQGQSNCAPNFLWNNSLAVWYIGGSNSLTLPQSANSTYTYQLSAGGSDPTFKVKYTASNDRPG